MTRAERTYLEEKLFTNLDNDLRLRVEKLLQKYEEMHQMFPDIHEVNFGIKFCNLILKHKSNKKPNYKYLIFQTHETQTSYYLYRKQILEHINSIVN